jgi:histidinol-phosphate aminotransferase
MDLPDYVPGPKVSGAIILASNEVAYPPPAAVVTAIQECAMGVNRYPDAGTSALRERIAATLGTGPDRVAVGCGSVSLCQQLLQAMCAAGDEVIFGWRSFEAYPILAQVVGARRRPVPLRPDLTHDLDATLAAIGGATRLVFVSNPNNPTGTALRRGELEAFLDAVPGHVLVVLDEAYREFVTDPGVPDGLALAARRDNVAVLRTFSKAYRLAGVRVGYCFAPPAVAGAVRRVGIPFSVSALAEAAALASLDAAEELTARCREVAQQRDRVRAALGDAGYRVPESQANFLWLPLGERTASFNEHCRDHKIVIRAFLGEGARVTIGTPAENDAFLAAASSFTG